MAAAENLRLGLQFAGGAALWSEGRQCRRPAGMGPVEVTIAPFQMIFEIGECILPVFIIRRSYRFVIEIDDPFILFAAATHHAHARAG
jgi:hypothetical protein